LKYDLLKMLFPQELWKKIKSYEYQLVHSPKIQKIISELNYHSYMPYYLQMHQYQGGKELYHYACTKLPKWNLYFTTTDMETLCDRLDKKAWREYN